MTRAFACPCGVASPMLGWMIDDTTSFGCSENATSESFARNSRVSGVSLGSSWSSMA